MEHKKYSETLEKMTEREMMVAVVLYLKDVKDLLESLLDGLGMEKKHY